MLKTIPSGSMCFFVFVCFLRMDSRRSITDPAGFESLGINDTMVVSIKPKNAI